MPLPAKYGQPARSVLWVDDEADLLEPHRLFGLSETAGLTAPAAGWT
jgi:hypothetical protein